MDTNDPHTGMREQAQALTERLVRALGDVLRIVEADRAPTSAQANEVSSELRSLIDLHERARDEARRLRGDRADGDWDPTLAECLELIDDARLASVVSEARAALAAFAAIESDFESARVEIAPFAQRALERLASLEGATSSDAERARESSAQEARFLEVMRSGAEIADDWALINDIAQDFSFPVALGLVQHRYHEPQATEAPVDTDGATAPAEADETPAPADADAQAASPTGDARESGRPGCEEGATESREHPLEAADARGGADTAPEGDHEDGAAAPDDATVTAAAAAMTDAADGTDAAGPADATDTTDAVDAMDAADAADAAGAAGAADAAPREAPSPRRRLHNLAPVRVRRTLAPSTASVASRLPSVDDKTIDTINRILQDGPAVLEERKAAEVIATSDELRSASASWGKFKAYRNQLPGVSAVVVPVLSRLCALSVGQVVRIARAVSVETDAQEVASCLEWLASKGIVCRYQVGPETYWSVTPYGAALMRIRSFRAMEAPGQERVPKRERVPYWLMGIFEGEVRVMGATPTRGELMREHLLSEACVAFVDEAYGRVSEMTVFLAVAGMRRDGSLIRCEPKEGIVLAAFVADEATAERAVATYPYVLAQRACMPADVAERLGFWQVADRWVFGSERDVPDVAPDDAPPLPDTGDAGDAGSAVTSGKGVVPKAADKAKRGDGAKKGAAGKKEAKKEDKGAKAEAAATPEGPARAAGAADAASPVDARVARTARTASDAPAPAASGEAGEAGARDSRDATDAPTAGSADKADKADKADEAAGAVGTDPARAGTSVETPVAAVAPAAPEAAGEPAAADVDATELDLARILDADGVPDEETVRRLLSRLLRLPARREGEEDFDGVSMALALSEAFELQGSGYARTLRAGLVLATDSPAADAHYTGQDLRSAFPEHTDETAAVELAAWCRALFNPEGQDWVLYNAARAYFDDYEDYFGAYPEVRPLFALLMRTKDCSVEHGFTKRVIGALADRSAWRANLDAVRARARDLRQIPDFKSSFVGVPQLSRALFGKDTEIGRALRVIERDDLAAKELVREAVAPFVREASVEAIEPEAVSKKIRDTWADVRRRTRSSATFGHETYERAIAEYTSRVQVAVTWLALSESGSDEATARFSRLRKDLLQTLPEVRASLVAEDDGSRPGIALLILLCDSIADVLAGDYHSRVSFAGFLRTGHVSLDDDLHPILDASHAQVTFFEPWRRVLAHVCAPHPTPAEALEATLDDESETFDNLRQQRQLERLLGLEPTRQDTGAARAAALDDERRFMSDLEMWFAYARIGEETRVRLERAAMALKEQLFAVGDFGMWRRLLACLTRQAALEGERQEEALAERLAEAESQKTSAPILAEARRMLDQDNLALAEEYLLRFEAGDWELAPSLADSVSDVNEFASFMDQRYYMGLFDEAFATRDTRPFPRVARQYLSRVAQERQWPQARLAKARSIFDMWPKEQGADLDAARMGKLLHSLGLEIRQCWDTGEAGEAPSDGAVSHYRAAFEPWSPTKAATHPISAFGSRRPEEVDACLVRSFTSPAQIAQLVEAHRAGGLLVVVVDERLTRTQRREVAELHMAGKRLTQFLLVDRVLALHLATCVVEERLRVLLKCTLPFTSLQPFVNGEGAVGEEMFVGRSDELREICSPEGTSLVYGGRQLGKSALLMQAARLTHDPDGKRFAVYVDVKRCSDEESFAATVAEHVYDAGFHSVKPQAVRSIADLERGLRRALQARKAKGKAVPRRSLLLLIDEADAILAALAPERYEALGPLIGLQRSPEVNFKFVLAGTHDVIRAKNADAANGVLGQIGNPCCIRPLPPQEALRLVMRPLMYVGVTIEDRSHLEMILANTNYYPGIVQLFGHNLVASIPSKFGGTYAAAKGNPPYVVDERQLGQAMFAHDLAREIKRKFLMTLELDEHGRYLEICRLVCYLTLEREQDGELYLEGFTADDLYQDARAWEVPALADETVSSLATLLEELCDMGVLARRGDDPVRYGMRRHKFLDYIGTMDDILQAFQSFEGR